MSETALPAAPPVTVAELRTVDLFDGVEDDALLERWAAAAVARRAPTPRRT